MAKLNLQSATARRSLVIRLVDDALIHSQSDLVRELGKLGYVVTQATASRDLNKGLELNLFKKIGEKNKTIYRLLTGHNKVSFVRDET